MKNKHYIQVLYLLTLVCAATLWRTPYVAFACLMATSTLLLQATRWKYTRMYLFCAVFGSLSEIVAIAAGAWSYANPQAFGIPIWLPLVWGSASILFVQISDTIKNKPKKAVHKRKNTKTAAVRKPKAIPRYAR